MNHTRLSVVVWRLQRLTRSPLCCCAWVLQERALAVRTIHFREHLFSECRQESKESFPIRPNWSDIGRKTLRPNILNLAHSLRLQPFSPASRTSLLPPLVWRNASTWPLTAATLPGLCEKNFCLRCCGTPYRVRFGSNEKGRTRHQNECMEPNTAVSPVPFCHPTVLHLFPRLSSHCRGLGEP
jgi:hypothetical protein